MAVTKMVIIEFMGTQRIAAGTDRVTMPVDGNTLASDAIAFVRDRYPALDFDEELLLITVNNELVLPQKLLESGDIICLLPGIGGG